MGGYWSSNKSEEADSQTQTVNGHVDLAGLSVKLVVIFMKLHFQCLASDHEGHLPSFLLNDVNYTLLYSAYFRNPAHTGLTS